MKVKFFWGTIVAAGLKVLMWYNYVFSNNKDHIQEAQQSMPSWMKKRKKKLNS